MRPFLTVWALLAMLSVAWAFATPISASPDEPAHLVRAASVVRGEWVGTPSPDGHLVTVPGYVARTQQLTCFAFHPELTAACPVDSTAPRDDDVATAATTAGLYNPVFYLAVGWPTLLFHDDAGIYGMRVVGALLTSLFAALAFAALWRLPQRRATVLGFGVAATPALLFLGGSVNPNGLEATATLAVFAAILAAVLDPDPGRLPARASLAAVAGAIAVNTRGLSPLWVLLAIALPLILAGRDRLAALFRRRSTWIAAAVIVVATIAAAAWTFGSNSLLNSVENPDSTPQSYPGTGTNPLSGFWVTLVRTVEYAHGVVGLFGWLDTPAPPEVFFVWAALVGGLLLAAFTLLRGRRLVFAAALLVLFIVLPPVLQAAYITGGGIIWQGRYAMPLFLCVVVGLAVALGDVVRPDPAASWWRRLTVIVVVAIAGSQLYAFENTLRRYAVGEDGSLKVFLVGSPPWSPPGGTLLWLLLTAATAVAGAWLAIGALRQRDEPEAADADVATPPLHLGGTQTQQP
jgi:hypothetical protein